MLKTDTLFRTNIDIFRDVSFYNIETEFIRFSLPLNHKKTVSRTSSVGVANVPSLIKFSQDWNRYLAFFLVLESTCSMLHACAQGSSASTMRKCLEKKEKIPFNFLSFEKLRNKND